MRKSVPHSSFLMQQIADSNNDPQLVDFVESEFLGEQVNS